MEARRQSADPDSDRRRFYAALGLFLLWVAALATMAVLSGRRPVPNPAVMDGR